MLRHQLDTQAAHMPLRTRWAPGYAANDVAMDAEIVCVQCAHKEICKTCSQDANIQLKIIIIRQIAHHLSEREFELTCKIAQRKHHILGIICMYVGPYINVQLTHSA